MNYNLDNIRDIIQKRIEYIHGTKKHDAKKTSITYNEMSRGLGRTTYMIKQLPADRPFILLLWKPAGVSSKIYTNIFIEKIQKERPDINIRNIEFGWVNNMNTLMKWKGSKDLYVDHTVFDMLYYNLMYELYS